MKRETCTIAANATLDGQGGAAVVLTVGSTRVFLTLESVVQVMDRLETCVVEAVNVHKLANDPDTAQLFWAQAQGVA